MIAGAAAISFAEAPASEQAFGRRAMDRECERYGLEPERVSATLEGHDPLAKEMPRRHWWELLVVGAAIAIFIWLGAGAERQAVAMNVAWMYVLIAGSVVLLVACRWLLWQLKGFS